MSVVYGMHCNRNKTRQLIYFVENGFFNNVDVFEFYYAKCCMIILFFAKMFSELYRVPLFVQSVVASHKHFGVLLTTHK